MKYLYKPLLTGIISSALLFSCNEGNNENANENTAEASVATVENQDKKVNVDNWPETAQKAAKAMMEKYGEPTESTPTMLVWENTGPFKRTIVYKEEIDHDFPMPHKDVLEQFVDYEVPADKFDELANYDGSVIVERTRGEMSARCDKEGANILALNLADDIIKDKRSVEEARQHYADAIMQVLKGEKPPYFQSLQFDAARGNVGDPGVTTMDMSKVKELKQKQK